MIGNDNILAAQKGYRDKILSLPKDHPIRLAINAKISKAKLGTISAAKRWIIMTPEGKEFLIYNLFDFCRKNGLHQSVMSKVARKKQQHHKGYKVSYLNKDNEYTR